MNFTCLLLADNANVQRFNTYIETQRKQFRVKTMLTSILNVQGEVLVTGSCTSEIGYFRIRLNPYDSVETVTCVNKKVAALLNDEYSRDLHEFACMRTCIICKIYVTSFPSDNYLSDVRSAENGRFVRKTREHVERIKIPFSSKHRSMTRRKRCNIPICLWYIL